MKYPSLHPPCSLTDQNDERIRGVKRLILHSIKPSLNVFVRDAASCFSQRRISRRSEGKASHCPSADPSSLTSIGHSGIRLLLMKKCLTIIEFVCSD